MFQPPSPTAPLRLGRRIFRSRLLETIVSPNGVDGYGEMLDPTFSMRDILAEVVAVRHQSARSVTLTLIPNGNWQGFSAGQHVGVIVEIDGVLTTRFYSPASSATDKGRLELTVSLHDGGAVSGHLIEHGRPGMILGLTPPEGEFVLPEKIDEPLLLISGGSGITPVISQLRTLAARRHTGAVAFVHFARTQDDALYREELASIDAAHRKFDVFRVFTRQRSAGDLHGHLSPALLSSIAEDFAERRAYVCGPPELTRAAEEIWAKAGASDRLHTESFKLPELAVATEDATGAVRFAASGVAIENDGRPLLEQAEDAGLSPRCGCRMGICHTCIAHVEEGVVRDLRSGELLTLKDEYVQTCVHAPVGDFEIDL